MLAPVVRIPKRRVCHRSDDPLLFGEELSRRVAPITGGCRDDMAGPSPDVIGSGTGAGEDPDHAVPAEQVGEECRGFYGGDVESPRHSTDGLSTGKALSEQGDGQDPGAKSLRLYSWGSFGLLPNRSE